MAPRHLILILILVLIPQDHLTALAAAVSVEAALVDRIATVDRIAADQVGTVVVGQDDPCLQTHAQDHHHHHHLKDRPAVALVALVAADHPRLAVIVVPDHLHLVAVAALVAALIAVHPLLVVVDNSLPLRIVTS